MGNIANAQTVQDFDGNVYNTITIGTQTWLQENLKTTHYLNGDAIETTSTPWDNISSEATPKYQWAYNGNESNVAIYGRLYTWYATNDSREVCPTGYHVPTIEEWNTLVDFLGGDAGGKMKKTGTDTWEDPNTGADNSSGFTAVGGACRTGSSFFPLRATAYLWSSSENSTDNSQANYKLLFYDYAGVSGSSGGGKLIGMSVRCLSGTGGASVPAAPSNLTITSQKNILSQMILSWTDNSNNEDGFKIERSIDDVTFTEIGTTASNITTYIDSTGAALTLYYYRVTAYNSAGSSAYSNTISGTTSGINDIDLSNIISMYPNPNTGKFAVSVSSGSINTIDIYNLLGEKIYTKNIKYETSTEIDLSNSPKGMYFVKVTDGEKTFSSKIVVE